MKKRNFLVRTIAITLAALVTCSTGTLGQVSAYAGTSDIITNANISMKVSMASIDNLTADSSMAVRLQNLSIQQLLRDYYDLNAQIDKLEKQVAVDKTNPILITKLIAVQDARDAKWKTYEDARENIGDVITPQIANIKVLYLSYASATLQEQKMALSIEKATTDLALAEKKLTLNYISQTQLDTIRDNYDKLINSRESVVNAKKSSLEKLLNALGLYADAEITQPDLFDVTVISKLDFASSLQASLTKNKTIKDAQDDLNDARNLTYPYMNDDTYEVKVAKTKLEGLQNTRTEAFTQSYDALKNAYDSYKKSMLVLERDLKKATQMETKFKLGYISKTQLTDFTRNLESEKLQQKIDNFSLFSQYISILNSTKGF